MRKVISIACLLISTSIFAQEATDESIVDGTKTAAEILNDLENLNTEIKQVNQLGTLVERKYGILRFLDRLNGQVSEISMPVGELKKEQHLNISLKSCYVPKDGSTSEAAAFLEIADERESQILFNGWMIASSPALSALDHPRYDVWVVACSDDGKIPKGAEVIEVQDDSIVEESTLP